MGRARFVEEAFGNLPGMFGHEKMLAQLAQRIKRSLLLGSAVNL